MAHGPNDAATQWLLDTMHNPKASLRHRIECAKTLLEVHPNEFRIHWLRDARDPSPDPAVPVLKIIIGGIGATTIPQADHEHIAEDHSPPRLN
jgi:hypothetical protein